MKLKDVPESTFTTAGINHLPLDSFEIEDGQYGKQVAIKFKNGEYFQKTWVSLKVDAIPDPSKSYLIAREFRKWQGVYEGLGKDWAAFEEELDIPIPMTEGEATKMYGKFVKDLLTQLTGQQVPVLLAYNNAGYLNIPTAKEMGWKLPFGNGVNVVEGLDYTKPTSAPRNEVKEETPSTPTTDTDGEDW